MTSKTGKKRKKRAQKSQKVEGNPVKILRVLDEKNAFHFYEGLGQSVGKSAVNLYDFLEKVNDIKLESLCFHTKRKDFQNWVKDTLGDTKLAKTIGRMKPTCNEALRKKLQRIIGKRIGELKEETIELGMMINEDWLVALELQH